jgi:hypothetical protein
MWKYTCDGSTVKNARDLVFLLYVKNILLTTLKQLPSHSSYQRNSNTKKLNMVGRPRTYELVPTSWVGKSVALVCKCPATPVMVTCQVGAWRKIGGGATLTVGEQHLHKKHVSYNPSCDKNYLDCCFVGDKPLSSYMGAKGKLEQPNNGNLSVQTSTTY